MLGQEPERVGFSFNRLPLRRGTYKPGSLTNPEKDFIEKRLPGFRQTVLDIADAIRANKDTLRFGLLVTPLRFDIVTRRQAIVDTIKWINERKDLFAQGPERLISERIYPVGFITPTSIFEVLAQAKTWPRFVGFIDTISDLNVKVGVVNTRKRTVTRYRLNPHSHLPTPKGDLRF